MSLATSQQQQSTGDKTTDWSTTLNFNQFDPSLGLLQSINIGLVGDISAWIDLQNLEAGPAAFSVSFPGLINVIGPDNTLLTAVAPDPSASGTLAANAGTILSGLTDTASSQTTLAAGTLGTSGFVGAGTVALPVTAAASLLATGPANLDLLSHASAGASVALDYNYQSDTAAAGGSSGSVTLVDITAGFPMFVTGPSTTQTFTLADRTTGWNDQLTVNRFNPALGRLVAVNITLANDIQASVAAENLGPDAATFDSSQAATATLGLDGVAAGVTAQAVANDTMALGSFDGTIDYAGASGHLDQGITQAATSYLSLSDPSQLAAFVGQGSVTLPISVTGTSVVDGPGNLAAHLLAQGGASVSITYSYDTAPTIAGAGGIVTYAAGQAATALAPTLDLTDNYTTLAASAQVTISGGVTGDVLAADTAGTGISASYDPTSETLNLSGTASVAAYQQVLRSVTFTSTSSDPSVGGTDTSRIATWSVTSPDGSTSDTATTGITIPALPAQWIGGGYGVWSLGFEWSSAPQVPGAGQDVAITQAGNYTIDVTTAETVHSVLLDAPGAVLRLRASLDVLAGFTVEAGTLDFEGGSLSVGSFAVDGGTVTGADVAIAATGGMDLNGGSLASSATVSAATIIGQLGSTGVTLQPSQTPIVSPGVGELPGLVDAPTDMIVQTLSPNSNAALQLLDMISSGALSGAMAISGQQTILPMGLATGLQAGGAGLDTPAPQILTGGAVNIYAP